MMQSQVRDTMATTPAMGSARDPGIVQSNPLGPGSWIAIAIVLAGASFHPIRRWRRSRRQ